MVMTFPSGLLVLNKATPSFAALEGGMPPQETPFPDQSRADCAAISPDRVDDL
jgi:hypothetical protein